MNPHKSNNEYTGYKLFTTDEAGILKNLFFLLLLTPQIGKRVDDDTEDQIKDDDNDNEEEQQVVYNSSKKQRLLMTKHNISLANRSKPIGQKYQKNGRNNVTTHSNFNIK